jgi:hypothetical protein
MLVDRMHGFTHKCPADFKLASYKDPDALALKSTWMESIWAKMRRLETTLLYTKASNSMHLLKYFVAMHNNEVNTKQRAAVAAGSAASAAAGGSGGGP